MSLTFDGLGLSAELLRAVTEEGYVHPTPVQVQAIPVILAGRDVLAGAQTGTGKTAGFALPMLQRLAAEDAADQPGRRRLRAMILTPTRELAAQIEESVRTYGRHLDLKSTLIYGGVGMTPQVDALKRGVDILVATPGRLLDHIGQKTVDLSGINTLVLDEADRMLDMGFIRDIRRILAMLPAKRQNLLFSATYSDEIRELADGMLHDPVMIEVARRNAESELVAQRVHPVDQSRKRELLAHLVSSGDWRQVLVFARTKHGANRLAQQLEKQGIDADAIHGNKSQPQRLRALRSFKEGTIRVLVATDIAARGLDIEELPHVVNFELPNVPEDYVHRIGRTGRAGSSGEAISLVCHEELPLLAEIEKLIRRKIERSVVPGFEPGTASEAPQQVASDRPPRPERVRGDAVPEAGVSAGPVHNPERRGRNRRGRGGESRGGEGRGGEGRGKPNPGVTAVAADVVKVSQPEAGDDLNVQRPPKLPGEVEGNSPRAERVPGEVDGNQMPRAARPPRSEGRRGDQPSRVQGEPDGNVLIPTREPSATDEYDERQPLSNASSPFPSSGRVFGEPNSRGGGGKPFRGAARGNGGGQGGNGQRQGNASNRTGTGTGNGNGNGNGNGAGNGNVARPAGAGRPGQGRARRAGGPARPGGNPRRPD